jgi:hypothetical protein
MKTYQALAIVPIIPDDDHAVLRIQTEEEGRIGLHMRREALESFFEHPKSDLFRPIPASDTDTEE